MLRVLSTGTDAGFVATARAPITATDPFVADFEFLATTLATANAARPAAEVLLTAFFRLFAVAGSFVRTRGAAAFLLAAAFFTVLGDGEVAAFFFATGFTLVFATGFTLVFAADFILVFAATLDLAPGLAFLADVTFFLAAGFFRAGGAFFAVVFFAAGFLVVVFFFETLAAVFFFEPDFLAAFATSGTPRVYHESSSPQRELSTRC